MTVQITEETSIELHRLHIGGLEDGMSEVGRPDTGVFVAMPEAGVAILRWLEMGLAAGEVIARFTAAYGAGPELAEFVDDLTECGFVKSVNGEPARSPAATDRSSGWRLLANLPTERVRWVLSRPCVAFYWSLWVATPLALLLRPDLLPRPSDAIVSQRPLLNILILAALGWLTVLIHEFAHIVATRARGAPSSLSLGRRLYILVVQTEMSGVRALPRAQRYAPYLAGMTVNIGILLGCLLARAAGDHQAIVAATGYVVLLQILFQFAIFLRTDLYYVMTNLLRVNNLAADTRLVLTGLRRRLLARPPVDLSMIPARERAIIRWYAPVHVVGIALAVVNLVIFVLPVPVTMGRVAIESLLGVGSQAPRWEAAAFLLLIGFEFGTVIVMAVRDRLNRQTPN